MFKTWVPFSTSWAVQTWSGWFEMSEIQFDLNPSRIFDTTWLSVCLQSFFPPDGWHLIFLNITLFSYEYFSWREPWKNWGFKKGISIKIDIKFPVLKNKLQSSLKRGCSLCLENFAIKKNVTQMIKKASDGAKNPDGTETFLHVFAKSASFLQRFQTWSVPSDVFLFYNHIEEAKTAKFCPFDWLL